MFKNKLYKFRKIIIIMLVILLIYIYFTFLINSSLNDYILNEINNKYKTNNNNYKNDILYDSLNKVVNKEVLDNESVKDVLIVQKNEIKKEEKNPIIYIYNTHETEKYSIPYVSDYSITPTVVFASYILKDYLNDYGVYSFIQTKSTSEYVKKHKLEYSGSYEASRVYMEEELKNNDYKILIDLHRDSAKYKYTLYKNDNKKYAKIMFVLTTKHKNYKENEEFVNDLNDRLNKKYKGITRGILKRNDVIFNQDKSPRAILIELGGVDNNLEEINNTLHVLAEVISEYVSEEL